MRGLLVVAIFGLGLASVVGAPERPGGWEKLEGCEYFEGPHSDGDSVEVLHEGKAHVFRVYFVDCIEENPRSAERRRAQASYFGVAGEEEALRHAHAAAAVTRELLEGRPFTVWTRWEMVTPGSDNPSIRAFIETADGRDLAQELVERGLAIIRGGQALADHPSGRSRSEILHELRELETRARVSGRGAWAKRGGVGEDGARAPREGRPQSAAAGKVFSPKEEEALRAVAGSEARVRGRLGLVSSLPDGRLTFLNFEGVPRGGFVAIVRGGRLAEFERAFGGPLPRVLRGREVEVRGLVTLYRNAPQIELGEPSQLRVLSR